MSCFLSVPLKQTSEVDLVKPLVSYIESLAGLSAEVRVRTVEGIVELDKLRKTISSQFLSKQQSSLELMIK